MHAPLLTRTQNPYPAPAHDQYGQAQQHQQGYGAPHGQYDQSYDANRSHSPYPPAAQHQQYSDPNQQYGQQQHGQQQYGQQQQHGYGDQQHQQGQYGQPGVPSGPGGPADGERGLGSTLIGGAGGAFLGNQLGGGALGTIGGLIAGAVGANMLSDK